MAPKYSLGKIYKIECYSTNRVYYGATCEPTLARRLAFHKLHYNRFLKGGSFYPSHLVIENGNYAISLVESYSCKSKDELNARELHFIKNNECCNKLPKVWMASG